MEKDCNKYEDLGGLAIRAKRQDEVTPVKTNSRREAT